jgi:hypothetical protein
MEFGVNIHGSASTTSPPSARKTGRKTGEVRADAACRENAGKANADSAGLNQFAPQVKKIGYFPPAPGLERNLWPSFTF